MIKPNAPETGLILGKKQVVFYSFSLWSFNKLTSGQNQRRENEEGYKSTKLADWQQPKSCQIQALS
jgi:hypothetical protein